MPKTITKPRAAPTPVPKVGFTKAVDSAKAPVKVNKVTLTAKPPTSWSFSRYSDFKQCPLKFKLKHIDKINEPKSEAMDKGIEAHDVAEKYIKGQWTKTLPLSLKLMKGELDAMKAMYKKKAFPILVEDNWAFKEDWSETQWDDWVGCWVRIKLDAAHYADGNTLVVTDWKTGKPSEYKNAEYMEQMELYAVSALLMSAVEDVTVRVRLAFTETGDIIHPTDKDGNEVVYTRKDLPKLKKEWAKRVKPMMTSKHFPPRANSGCKWCWYGQAKVAAGGPNLCQY
jgi:putative RecB family exonuclease